MSEPRTAVGRALLHDSWRHWSDPDNWRESLRLRILAIEAEARAAALDAVQRLPRIMLTGEQLDSLGYGLVSEHAIDFDEHEFYVSVAAIDALRERSGE